MVSPQINVSLRQHVTSVGFSLTLGKTHIAALVMLDIKLKHNRTGFDSSINYTSSRPPRVFNGPTGTSGLIERGLVQHIMDQRRRPGENILAMTPRRIWRITPAGRLVVNLLKEAGLYQEYAAMLPVAERREAR
jgi:hypothetical protein